MTRARGIFRRRQMSLVMLLLAIFYSEMMHAQAVDDVLVRASGTGFEIEVKFFTSLRYQSHWPQESGDTLEIQLRLENFNNPEILEQLDERSSLSWDKRSDIPVR